MTLWILVPSFVQNRFKPRCCIQIFMRLRARQRKIIIANVSPDQGQDRDWDQDRYRKQDQDQGNDCSFGWIWNCKKTEKRWGLTALLLLLVHYLQIWGSFKKDAWLKERADWLTHQLVIIGLDLFLLFTTGHWHYLVITSHSKSWLVISSHN